MTNGPDEERINQIEFVIFRIASQHYALPIHRVKEVLSYGKITPLPASPPFMEGVIDLRGALIPVIDLRKRLGFTEIRNDLETRILVLLIGKKKVGVVVDSVLQVLPIAVENIQQSPETARLHGINYILAFAKSQEQLYIILDMDRLLTTSEALKLEELTFRDSTASKAND